MAVHVGVAVAREVLDGSGGLGALKAFYEGAAHIGCDLRVVRERAQAYDRVVRVVVEVQHRREIKVYAQGF